MNFHGLPFKKTYIKAIFRFLVGKSVMNELNMLSKLWDYSTVVKHKSHIHDKSRKYNILK